MMQIPIQAVPSQTLSVVLGAQNCQLNIYSRLGFLYIDVYVNNQPIILGVQCENANRIVRSVYLGFIGDLVFVDTQGTSDPFYAGLGARFLLEYLETADLVIFGFVA